MIKEPQQFALNEAVTKAYEFFSSGQLEAAKIACENRLSAQPNCADSIHLLGLIAFQCGNHKVAIPYLQKSVAMVEKNYFLNNLGAVLQAAGRKEEAAKNYTRASQLEPHSEKNAGRFYNLANIYKSLRQYDNAISAYKNSIRIRPTFTQALAALGDMQLLIGNYKEAMDAYRTAIKIDPEKNDCIIKLAFANRQACIWNEKDNISQEKFNKMIHAALILDTHRVIALSTSPYEQLFNAKKQALKYSNSIAQTQQPSFQHLKVKPAKIKVGYLSADFREHAVGNGIVGLLENQNHTDFEIYAYSLGDSDYSQTRSRIIKAVDRFVDLQPYSYQEAADKIRKDNMHILIDIGGYTGSSQTEIFAYKSAPIQVNYFGFPATMGASFMDYIVADEIVLPQNQQINFSEKIVRMPESYFVCDNKRKHSDNIRVSKEECQLPADSFVFCSFNNSYKITSTMFDLWMRLLTSVPSSVLWLIVPNELAAENARLAAKHRGIQSSRLIFAPRLKNIADHLARYRLVDLFLDTLPYNAHSTAADALGAGCPLITCTGDTFASRVASSILIAIGLPELITKSLEEYETLALHLARQPRELDAIRQKLVKNYSRFPLFNNKRYAKHFEIGLKTMWEAFVQDKQPEPFSIEPLPDPVANFM